MRTEVLGRGMPPTYFVGRREDEAAEVFAITGTRIERLTRALDWRAGDIAALELSHLLLGRVASGTPPLELEARFGLGALAHFPEDGFVLNADALRLWLRRAGGRHLVPDRRPARRSWADRLRRLFP